MAKPDEDFYERAGAFIDVANGLTETATRDQVSASMMFGTAKFNAWAMACGAKDAFTMTGAKKDMMEYLVDQYRKMLELNIDDYIENFDTHMKPKT